MGNQPISFVMLNDTTSPYPVMRHFTIYMWISIKKVYTSATPSKPLLTFNVTGVTPKNITELNRFYAQFTSDEKL